MSNIHAMNLALVDMEERLQRELQFSADDMKQVRDGFGLVRESVDNLERIITNAMTARMRAMSSTIGNGAPSPETIEVAKVAKVAAEQSDA